MNVRRRKEQLKKQERKLRVRPNAEGYLRLATAYAEVRLNDDALRMLEMAEKMLGAVKQTESQLIRQKYYMSGILNRDILTEIIQLYNRLSVEGVLVLEMRSGTARVYFQRGTVINVRLAYGVPEGLEGLKEVLKDCHGNYHFIQRPVVEVKTSVFVNCQQLLLEALKALDESAVR